MGQAGTPRATPTAVEHAQAVAGWYLSTQRGESTYFSIMNRLTTIHLAASADGTLSMGAMRLVETAPWVFQQVDGPNVVSAVVEDGQVQRVMMYGAIAWDRTTVWTGPLVWVPIMGGGALLLVTALLAWPLAAGCAGSGTGDSTVPESTLHCASQCSVEQPHSSSRSERCCLGCRKG